VPHNFSLNSVCLARVDWRFRFASMMLADIMLQDKEHASLEVVICVSSSSSPELLFIPD
jgi:hypothetical protein